VFIALLHWLIFIILLLQGLSKHARDRSGPSVSRPYAERPGTAAPPDRERADRERDATGQRRWR